ncbi:MAG TPA: hypothetical protein VIT88_01245 [Pyrinomonadaceae bacterium]
MDFFASSARWLALAAILGGGVCFLTLPRATSTTDNSRLTLSPRVTASSSSLDVENINLSNNHLNFATTSSNWGPPPIFEDNPLEQTTIRSIHITQLRSAIDALRSHYNLGNYPWQAPAAAGDPISIAPIQEMRTALDQALGPPSGGYAGGLASGQPILKLHIQELRDRVLAAWQGNIGSIEIERLEPANRTGGDAEDPLSRNFNWTLPILSLPGRSGMDLGLSLSYNSLVWLKSSGNNISFDVDGGFPSPGFRLGFPVIKPQYFNDRVGKNGVLLVRPDGSRTELRQVGMSALYEAADSSYLLFDLANRLLRTPDGTLLSYTLMGSQYNCTQIKDRNGNYITVNYDGSRIDTVVDTLGRNIKFNYVNGRLKSISQIWNEGPDQVTHDWAVFDYDDTTTMQTNFPGLTVNGPSNGSVIGGLSKLTLVDGAHYDFAYTTWGQVWKVSSVAPDGHLLNYRSYNLPETAATSETDCPRFTERRDWAESWNGDTDGTAATSEEVITKFARPEGISWRMPNGIWHSGMRAQVTTHDGTSHKLYFSSRELSGPPCDPKGGFCTQGFIDLSWQRSLQALAQTFDGDGMLQRQVMTTFTQDNTSVPYELNPRVAETNVYDAGNNRARRQITYKKFTFSDGTSCHYPEDVYQYAGDATTILRSTRTKYNESTTYSDLRILGLVSEKTIYDGNVNSGGVLMSKLAFNYDETGSIVGTDAPVQHDNDNFGASVVSGRANLSSVKRFDVFTTAESITITTTKYNTAGGLVSSKDAAAGHEVLFSYADSFSDGKVRNTLAYLTKVTDGDLNSVTAKYSFDFGAVTEQQRPKPNLSTYQAGPVHTFTYDEFGRLQRSTSAANGAYTRFEYAASNNRIDTYTKVDVGLDEARSFQITDGLGRVIAVAKDHPGGTDVRFSGQLFVYDAMSRVIKTSNPTETDTDGPPSRWKATGDDQEAGWLYTHQTYDWNGRRLITTNQDGTSKTASYTGCGCAGGDVTTLTDEMNRQQKVYSDVFGRAWKIEVLTVPDANQNRDVYSTNVAVYNSRDQIIRQKQYAGPAPTEASSTNAAVACPSGTCQETVITFDGHARLKTRHLPLQKVDPNNPASTDRTTWTYNADDTIKSVTDARGVSSTRNYNNRHLLTSVTFAAPANISHTPEIRFGYDAAGNRISMTDGSGSVNYEVNSLSQIVSEKRTFNGLPGQYTIGYEYNLLGNLKTLTYSNGGTVNYAFDSVGRTKSVNSNQFAGVSDYVTDIQYRASGDQKKIFYGNDTQLELSYNARLQLKRYNTKHRLFQGQRSDMKFVDFQYHADGRLSSAPDSTDPRFSRIYKFDHVGRLSQEGGGVYNQIYEYNAFGNVTDRMNVLWSSFDRFTAMYVNGRNQNSQWKYDAEGNITFDDKIELKYDAIGVNTSIRSLNDNQTVSQTVDGDGQLIKRTTPIPWRSTIYYLRSTALDGDILTEIDGTISPLTGQPAGTLLKHYLYLDGEVLATINEGNVFWQHTNPLTGAISESDPQGIGSQKVEPDSMGVNLGFEDPFAAPPSEPREPDIASPNPFAGTGECRVEGILFSCVAAGRLLGGGSAVRCPDDNCGPRSIPVTTENGEPGWILTHSFVMHADGIGGFIPVGVTYEDIVNSTLGEEDEELSKLGSMIFNLAPQDGKPLPDKKKKKKRKRPSNVPEIKRVIVVSPTAPDLQVGLGVDEKLAEHRKRLALSPAEQQKGYEDCVAPHNDAYWAGFTPAAAHLAAGALQLGLAGGAYGFAVNTAKAILAGESVSTASLLEILHTLKAGGLVSTPLSIVGITQLKEGFHQLFYNRMMYDWEEANCARKYPKAERKYKNSWN